MLHMATSEMCCIVLLALWALFVLDSGQRRCREKHILRSVTPQQKAVKALVSTRLAQSPGGFEGAKPTCHIWSMTYRQSMTLASSLMSVQSPSPILTQASAQT